MFLSFELILIIIAFLMVLSVLAFLVYRNNKLKAKKTSQKEAFVSESASGTVLSTDNEADNDERVAAFLALHLYMSEEIHDEESNVLTIDRIQRRYSPWSSKIYSMNNPQR